MESTKQYIYWLLALACCAGVGTMPQPFSQKSGHVADTQEQNLINSLVFGHKPKRSSEAASPQDKLSSDQIENDAKFVSDFLRHYGYFKSEEQVTGQEMKSNASNGRHRLRRNVLTPAIRNFQAFYGIPQTGTPDKDTLELMKTDRCGVADVLEKSMNTSRPLHNTDDRGVKILDNEKRWDKNQLTWRLSRPTNRLSKDKQRATITKAFDTWAGVANLTFAENDKDVADIDMSFTSGFHNDCCPFDGPGKVLAHAFKPGRSSLSGDVHFDDDEMWSIQVKNDSEVDLYLAAIHELGHSLGLQHSNDRKSVMYAYFMHRNSVELTDGDIQAIQSLYGNQTFQMSSPASTTASTGCYIQFDFVIKEQSHGYAGIRENQVYRFTEHDGLLQSYPKPLQDIYADAPVQADSVFSVPESRSTYFLKANKIWKYTDSVLQSNFPKHLNSSHFAERVKCVFAMWNTSTSQTRFFVFSGTRWWDYNFDHPQKTAPRLYFIYNNWPFSQDDIQYIVQGYDNNMYAVSNNSYVIMDTKFAEIGRHSGQPTWIRNSCPTFQPKPK